MKIIFISIVSCFLLFSCTKETTEPSTFSEARYMITITGQWSSPAFTVPGGAHYTTFIGMIHNSTASLWKDATKASYGTEVLAETGGGGPILAEIDSMVAEKNALSLVLFAAPATTGTAKVNFACNNNYSLVSFASMLGPTPDWFIGVSGVRLYRNSSWVTDTIINLYAYDAGTEDGDVFGYNNPASVPLQNIHPLQASQATVLANGNPVLAPIATARFVKQ
jgi:hypothetical protein